MTIHKLCLLLLLCACQVLQAQDCDIRISGKVLDKSTNQALEFSNLLLVENQKAAVSDVDGLFQIDGVCPGEYHLSIGHIGCEDVEVFLNIERDTFINIYLSHHVELLDEVVIHGTKEDNTSEVSSSITQEAIATNSNKNLSDLLEQITGVSVLRSGAGISKPIIHGLYGNRVAILNNGIAQSGQQWGNDHAPEIDPFTADHISVVKGAGALAYNGSSLGSVVLVESEKIKDDPHLHGELNYVFQTNGKGHTLNAMLQHYHNWISWRVKASMKRIGDQHTPSYWLSNSGRRENSIALQLENKISSRWHNELYYSFFNTDIAILRASHIGNLTDLENAIQRTEPIFTTDQFSYDIDAPRQAVKHHLLKFESKYFITEGQVVKLRYGGQLNQRKEFDIRRGGRTSKPSLSLDQSSHFIETNYHATAKNGLLWKSGVQLNIVENTNNPGTGVFPLIPNYKSFSTAVFSLLQREQQNLLYEFGARYSNKNIEVFNITGSLPRRIEVINHDFHNYALSAGLKYQANNLKTNLNFAYMLRAPEVNELYSAGLHQGVSGIEEGNRDLASEKSFKVVLSSDWAASSKLFFQALTYYHRINDYIYLQAENEFRLTIRGAFPVFTYKQVNADLYGADLLIKYEPTPHLKMVNKLSFIEGRDQSNKLALVNIPSTNISSEINYSFSDGTLLKNSFVQLNGQYVFRQSDISAEQDFLIPPDGYFLLGCALGTQIKIKESTWRLRIKAENLLNKSYRDYLNRFRYFADELGFNLNINLNYSF